MSKKLGNVNCFRCNKLFEREIRIINWHKKTNINNYCSSECRNAQKTTSKTVDCKQCFTQFIKQLNQIKENKNDFCSRSCAATYNNTHKTTGTRRSKLEVYLEKQLISLYPNLEIHFNRKDAINSELDIYIPALKLAFELNGIFHYEPIYGQDKLDQILNNDNRKFQACLEFSIELCIIDSSQLKYFKPSNAKKYLDMITKIINIKSGNSEPPGEPVTPNHGLF